MGNRKFLTPCSWAGILCCSPWIIWLTWSIVAWVFCALPLLNGLCSVGTGGGGGGASAILGWGTYGVTGLFGSGILLPYIAGYMKLELSYEKIDASSFRMKTFNTQSNVLKPVAHTGTPEEVDGSYRDIFRDHRDNVPGNSHSIWWHNQKVSSFRTRSNGNDWEVTPAKSGTLAPEFFRRFVYYYLNTFADQDDTTADLVLVETGSSTRHPKQYKLESAATIASRVSKEMATGKLFDDFHENNTYLAEFETKESPPKKVYSLLRSLPQINKNFEMDAADKKKKSWWNRLSTSTYGGWIFAPIVLWIRSAYQMGKGIFVKPTEVTNWVPSNNEDTWGVETWTDGFGRSDSKASARDEEKKDDGKTDGKDDEKGGGGNKDDTDDQSGGSSTSGSGSGSNKTFMQRCKDSWDGYTTGKKSLIIGAIITVLILLIMCCHCMCCKTSAPAMVPVNPHLQYPPPPRDRRSRSRSCRSRRKSRRSSRSRKPGY